MVLRKPREALLAVVLLTVASAMLGETSSVPPAEADLGSPGGIAALPSSIPAIPGVANQSIPAIVGSGQPVIVVVFCDDGTAALPFDTSECANPITFELTRLFPESGATLATFAVTGTDSLVLVDNATADMDAAIGVVAVEVDAGWGMNEVVRVTATDDVGDARSVNIVVVDTILAWGPAGAVGTVSQVSPAFISLSCDDVGRGPLPVLAQLAEGELADGDGWQGLDDMYDGLYGQFNGLGDGWGSNTLPGDADFLDLWCGGDTTGLFDDFVDFQTDLGSFSVAPALSQQQMAVDLAAAAGFFYPLSLDSDCGEGQQIDTFDIDALSAWGDFLHGWPEGGCDVDGWRNGVVTTLILSSGEVGVATITSQQGGGGSPPRTINVTFVPSYGDTNCDAAIDSVDALFILQYVVGMRSCSDQCPPPAGTLYCGTADVNPDGAVDAVDALFVLQCVVGLRSCDF